MSRDRFTLAFDHHNMVPAPAGVATVQVIFKSEDGILLCYGITKPVDDTAGYAKGCLFMHTDGDEGDMFYINEGDADDCNFDATLVTTDEVITLAMMADESVDSDQYVDGSIDSAHLNENLIQFAEVDITSDQIKAMKATPILLIAAPGANKILELINVSYHFTYSTAAYVVQNNWLGIKLGDGNCGTIDSGANLASIYRMDILERGTDAYGIMSGGSGLYEETDGVYYDAANKGMYFVCENREPTAGSGTLKFLITYRVLDFS